MTDAIARGVAGLGNTYAGLLLVGVSDNRVVRGAKQKTAESVSDRCAAKIEPPWVPEIVPVARTGLGSVRLGHAWPRHRGCHDSQRASCQADSKGSLSDAHS
jgi:hypothetical protein